MQSRECGAAHINIFFFLIMLLLFLGALGFGYVQLTTNAALVESNQALRLENKQLKIDVQIRDHYMEDVRKVVGEAGTYEGRTNADGTLFIYVDEEDPQKDQLKKDAVENVALASSILNTVNEFTRQVQIAETQATPLSNLLAQAKQVIDGKDKRIADLQQQNSALVTARDQARAAKDAADAAKNQEVAKLTQEKADLRQWMEGQLTEVRTDMASVTAEVRQRQEALDAATETFNKQAAEYKKEINLKNARIDAQMRLTQLVNPPQAPDGAVISASQAAGKAWINLGRKDMLPRGTIFRITSPDSPGIKAHGRVSRLEKDRAEVDLFNVADPFDPVAKGDLISNDLYSPNLRRNIYLMGRFSFPMNKPEVKIILEKLGNRVHDKVGPNVDLVLVGDDTLNEERDGFIPVTDSKEYQDALSLGIEIATLNKVREFLTLGE